MQSYNNFHFSIYTSYVVFFIKFYSLQRCFVKPSRTYNQGVWLGADVTTWDLISRVRRAISHAMMNTWVLPYHCHERARPFTRKKPIRKLETRTGEQFSRSLRD